MAIGETCSNIPTPTRTNYTFNGWFTAAEGGNLIDNNNINNIQTDTVLYAHWSMNGLTVTISEDLVPTTHKGQDSEVTSSNNYGAKTIKYITPEGNTAYWNPGATGSFQIKKNSTLTLMLKAGNGGFSDPSYLSWYNGSTYLDEKTGEYGAILTSAITATNNLVLSYVADYQTGRFSWCVQYTTA